MMDDWPIVTKRMDELIPADYNPRVMDEDSAKGLSESLARFGMVEPVVWNKRTGNVVGGHQRLEVLRKNGTEEVDVVEVDLSKSEEVALNITLNNSEIEGEWEANGLADVLSGVGEDLRDALNFDVLESLAETNTKGFRGGNEEIDIDKLTEKCDATCPCCGFEWESDDKDYFEIKIGGD